MASSHQLINHCLPARGALQLLEHTIACSVILAEPPTSFRLIKLSTSYYRGSSRNQRCYCLNNLFSLNYLNRVWKVTASQETSKAYESKQGENLSISEAQRRSLKCNFYASAELSSNEISKGRKNRSKCKKSEIRGLVGSIKGSNIYSGNQRGISSSPRVPNLLPQ